MAILKKCVICGCEFQTGKSRQLTCLTASCKKEQSLRQRRAAYHNQADLRELIIRRAREYRAAHREQIREKNINRHREYYVANREQILKRRREAPRHRKKWHSLKNCVICGGEFQAKHPRDLTCSTAHRRERQLERYRKRKPNRDDRVREYNRKYYAANRDMFSEYNRKYQAVINRDKLSKSRRKYYEATRERVLQSKRHSYRLLHPLKQRLCVICGREFKTTHLNVTCSSSKCNKALRVKQNCEWREANRERLKIHEARKKARRSANRERYNKRCRAYYEANRERYKKYRAASWKQRTERARKIYELQVLAYKLLKLRGAAPDHLPTRESRLRFAYRQLRRYLGVLTPPTTTQQEKDK